MKRLGGGGGEKAYRTNVRYRSSIIKVVVTEVDSYEVIENYE